MNYAITHCIVLTNSAQGGICNLVDKTWFIERVIEGTTKRIFEDIFHSITVPTPGMFQKMSKQCNSLGIFSGLVVFLGLFFEKFGKM